MYDDALTGTVGVTPPPHIRFTGALQPRAENKLRIKLIFLGRFQKSQKMAAKAIRT